ncbi:MAG: IPT/TIG domain-containing protein [Saprospiraceae bacterium]|nr:IPT/TIG domain-containing protein [Saprospiraceae bacterium]
MQKLFSKNILLLLLFGIGMSMLVISCDKDNTGEEVDPNKIELLSFGPSPALRGGELQFIGRNLDKVTEIVLPSNVSVTNFKSKTAQKLVINIPDATVDGTVTLKTPQGDIVTKSMLTISEPITIVSIAPAAARPGSKITITGTYLNLIESVIFADNKVVEKAGFISQSREKLELNVPADAKTGKVSISNGEAIPIVVTSETDLVVTLPTIAALAPKPVKAGSILTITGTDLDLVREVVFGGNQKVIEFEAQSATEMKVAVPAAAQDGPVKVSVASLVEVTSADNVEMVVSTISEIAPNPAKPGTALTISGTDLDLVTSVTFGGNKVGSITQKDGGSLTVTVPLDATEGVVTVGTAANKSASSANVLVLKVPQIAAFSETSLKSSTDLTITGTDMDLVVEVLLTGGTKGANLRKTEGQIIFTVPPGTKDGPVTLVTTNGTQIVSDQSLTILVSNVPTITGFPPTAKPGQMIVLTGEKMDITTNVIFPGNAVATKFGVKTANMIEVVVPDDVKKGLGVITFVTFDGETTTSPAINFQGVDAVVDPNLVFFDFNGTGAKDSWWGNVKIVNDSRSVDGTSFGEIDGNYNGWTDCFWRNSDNNFPGEVVGTNIADYVIKFDINVLEPITAGALKLRIHNNTDDYWWNWGPGAPDPQAKVPVIEKTDGWITKTVGLLEFANNYGWNQGRITDLTTVQNEFGMAFDNGASRVHILIDNVRLEKK